MCNLNGKNIVLGITGGIAAYKSLSLIRLFKAHHCDVKVVATRHALQFVTPLTIETLSQNKLYVDTFEQMVSRDVRHISLSEWADCMVVAPATANIIAKFASGMADDALSTLFLAMQAPLFLAPAMNNKMFENELVQQNIKKLQNFGVQVIEPQSGFLACGTEGKGRMEEPEAIFERIKCFFNEGCKLKGKKAMVSAGPTYEPIDPVRFIGNHSSGLMGYSIAEQLAKCGAEVMLISGPTHLQIKHPLIQRIDVNTAAEMYHACMRFVTDYDVAVMAAAVADYTPQKTALEKIKKHEERWSLPLV
ncbi:MAG: bifunctional phosphopantothenoylcysteine decarboxylase/phosphopantothenate--cysteine ligase CoaBC, partial [Bacteroidales bacterium]